ncbi:unnamed protein product, partial [Closterium sp. NIES-54]
ALCVQTCTALLCSCSALHTIGCASTIQEALLPLAHVPVPRVPFSRPSTRHLRACICTLFRAHSCPSRRSSLYRRPRLSPRACSHHARGRGLAGLEGDLSKALRDGKPVIIEGTHIDPDANFLSFSAAPPPLPTPLPPLPHAQPATPPPQPGAAPSAAWGTGSGGGGGGGERGGEMGCGREVRADDPMDVEGSTPCAGCGGQGGMGGQGRGGGGGMAMMEEGGGRDECGGRGDGEQGRGAGEIVGGGLGEEGGRAQTLGSRESEGKHLRSGASSGGAAGGKGLSHVAQAEAAAASGGAGKRLRPIVVPIVLHMHPADHKVLLSEWIASNAPNAALLSQVTPHLHSPIFPPCYCCALPRLSLLCTAPQFVLPLP